MFLKTHMNSMFSTIFRQRFVIDTDPAVSSGSALSAITPAALEESARALVRARGPLQLCTRTDDDAFVAPSELRKRATNSGMLQRRRLGDQ
jgi:hypothetical protein